MNPRAGQSLGSKKAGGIDFVDHHDANGGHEADDGNLVVDLEG